jgi:hypothetical protein
MAPQRQLRGEIDPSRGGRPRKVGCSVACSVAVASFQPGSFGPRDMKAAGSGAHGQIARLVERAPDAGVAAPRTQPAESDQRRDPCDYRGLRLFDHGMRGGRRLIPTSLLQQCVGEPRRLPQPRRIKVAFGAEVDALAQPCLGIRMPERIDATRPEAGEDLTGESVLVGTLRQCECTLECRDALVDLAQIELRAADRLQHIPPALRPRARRRAPTTPGDRLVGFAVLAKRRGAARTTAPRVIGWSATSELACLPPLRGGARGVKEYERLPRQRHRCIVRPPVRAPQPRRFASHGDRLVEADAHMHVFG